MSSQRELLHVGAACSIPQVMIDLASAISGAGPALGFGECSTTSVSPDICVVIGTSGSTGSPKEVGISASALVASARASHKFLGAKPGQQWSLLLPMIHIAAVNVLTRSVELGTSPIDLRTADKYMDADFTAIVPTQLFRALNGDALLLNHLQKCQAVLVGGAALPDAIRKQATELGINLVSTYGMTETTGGCVYNNQPLDGVALKISSQGLIAISGPVLASIYINDEKSWNRSIVDGSFITSDLGTLTNNKLTVDGRADDVIISGGEKISLSAVESALQSRFPNIEFAAFAIADAEWGSALHVAIAGESTISTSEITAFLSSSLGEIAKPKGFISLPSLPLISIGKVDRKALSLLMIHERQMQ